MIARLQKSVTWLVLAVGAATAAISYTYWAKNTGRCITAHAAAERCQQVATQLEQLRAAPQKARLASRSADDLGSVVEKAATDAQLARDRVLRIDPQPAKRLGKSDYLEQTTEVELLAVSLRQLIGFVYNLSDADRELAMGSLRLQVPHTAENSGGEELWLANLVLTQRIYAPLTGRR